MKDRYLTRVSTSAGLEVHTVFVRDADLTTKLALTCLISMKIKRGKLNMTLGRIKFRYGMELTRYSDAEV